MWYKFNYIITQVQKIKAIRNIIFRAEKIQFRFEISNKYELDVFANILIPSKISKPLAFLNGLNADHRISFRVSCGRKRTVVTSQQQQQQQLRPTAPSTSPFPKQPCFQVQRVTGRTKLRFLHYY